jgi:hypothetical protein
MRIKLIAAALLGAAVLTGCNSHGTRTNPIQAGQVIGKEYVPAFDEPISYEQQDGSYSSPVLEHHPECWSVAFSAKNDWNFSCVTRDKFDSIKIGDWYVAG